MSAPAAAPSRELARARARVQGTVQGVGFRPYVYRLAIEHRLAGYVLNDARGVLLEVEGAPASVRRFLARLAPESPPLAVVESVLTEQLPPAGEAGFAIRESPREARADTPIAPDCTTCADCLRELLDPRDRRYRYPFTNCTNCGPRFTIVRGVPYDRPYTTMARFHMCARCRAEYEDPADRRFHAQPNACPACGPALSLLRLDGAAVDLAADEDPLQAAAGALRDGAIVAVKGLGGFHLAALATDERAVAALRTRKHREDKPFALMVATLAQAAEMVVLGDAERELLSSPARPIVLAPRREHAAVAAAVAPASAELGVMLPYSPLHHLLLADSGPLVMTSGNVSDEPIVFRDEEVLARLGAIADLVLVHDRPIETRTDDSVVRVGGGGRTVMLRRSRGYVPAGLPLAMGGAPPLLACGAELKNTFCLARDGQAWVSHHIGDLENYETLSSFTHGIEHFERMFAVEPQALVHDLHPDYLSTKWAFGNDDELPLIGVQHHHAHLAACLAEHGEQGSALGAIFDGTGYGPDGTIWGGELLCGDTGRFRRVGMLMPVRLPGGAQAIRQPWRMACAWLHAAGAAGGDGEPELPPVLAERVGAERWRQAGELVRTGLNSPLTTSAGRLFDAVAALCGLRPEVTYEGQAAIELEAACDPHEAGEYPIALAGGAGLVLIDPRETLLGVLADVRGGVPTARIASRFHAAFARVTVEAVSRAAAAAGVELAVLSGGVFANRRLLDAVARGLGERGLRVLVPERLPIGDGGISYGQAAVAARRLGGGDGGSGR